VRPAPSPPAPAPSIPCTFTNLHIPIYAHSAPYKLHRFVFFHVCCEFVYSDSRTARSDGVSSFFLPQGGSSHRSKLFEHLLVNPFTVTTRNLCVWAWRVSCYGTIAVKLGLKRPVLKSLSSVTLLQDTKVSEDLAASILRVK
jgi:hypothetical protein